MHRQNIINVRLRFVFVFETLTMRDGYGIVEKSKLLLYI